MATIEDGHADRLIAVFEAYQSETMAVLAAFAVAVDQTFAGIKALNARFLDDIAALDAETTDLVAQRREEARQMHVAAFDHFRGSITHEISAPTIRALPRVSDDGFSGAQGDDAA